MILDSIRAARRPEAAALRARVRRLVFTGRNASILVSGVVLNMALFMLFRGGHTGIVMDDWVFMLLWSVDCFGGALILVTWDALRRARDEHFLADMHLAGTPPMAVLAPFFDFLFGLLMADLAVEMVVQSAFDPGPFAPKLQEWGVSMAIGLGVAWWAAVLMLTMTLRGIPRVAQMLVLIACNALALGTVNALSMYFMEWFGSLWAADEGSWLARLMPGMTNAMLRSTTLAWWVAFAAVSAAMALLAAVVSRLLPGRLQQAIESTAA
jgi:hypothetical protein